MTSRERFLAAVNHEQPDRPPIDLGSMRVSGINAMTYARLHEALRVNKDPVKVFDVYQMLAKVEQPVREILGVDVVPILQLKPAFSLSIDKWIPGSLSDGTPCLYPKGFLPVQKSDGSEYLYQGDTLIAKRPAFCPYFEQVCFPLCNAVKQKDIELHRFEMITPDELEFLKHQVSYWKNNFEYGLVGGFGGMILEEGNFRFGQQRFMELLALEPDIVTYFFDRVANWQIANLKLYLEAIGKDIDAILMADDLGGQHGPLISPEMYRRLVKPYHARVFDFIRKNFHGTLVLHCCGAIRSFLPDLIEVGVQAINPVQVATEGMDAVGLKRDFGKHLVFWGGGVDSQTTLPFGTQEEVVNQAIERLQVFAPGGGFVFGTVHNIQAGTDPEKIIAAFRVAREST